MTASNRELASLADKLAQNAEFFAGWLPAGRHGIDELAVRLRLDRDSVDRLLICRAPRQDSFPSDVTAIASFLQLDRIALMQTLREIVAIAALHQADPASLRRITSSSGTMLAAARDAVEESFGTVRSASGRVRLLAESILKLAAELQASDTDLDSVIGWHSPVAIITLPRLGLRSVAEWLALKGVGVTLPPVDRPLRGLLLAWRGIGLIVLEGGLSPNERRFTLAHEWGHFLLDYQEPRKRILERAPDLLEVVDGHRPVTADDRARAVIEQLTLGVHAQLIERDQQGDASWDVDTREDIATHFALELLSPWSAVTRLLRENIDKTAPYESALSLASALIAERFRLPLDAAKGRARTGLAAIGHRRWFFEL